MSDERQFKPNQSVELSAEVMVVNPHSPEEGDRLTCFEQLEMISRPRFLKD